MPQSVTPEQLPPFNNFVMVDQDELKRVRRLIRDSSSRPGQTLEILSVLLESLDFSGRCNVNRNEIAAELETTVNNVSTALKFLEGIKAIRIERRGHLIDSIYYGK